MFLTDLNKIRKSLPDSNIWKVESLLVKDFSTVMCFLNSWYKDDMPIITDNNIKSLISHQSCFVCFENNPAVYVSNDRIF